MDVSIPDETRLKTLLKEALIEVLEQRREWFAALIVEVMEEIALVQAIKEGEDTDVASREEIFALLEA